MLPVYTSINKPSQGRTVRLIVIDIAFHEIYKKLLICLVGATALGGCLKSNVHSLFIRVGDGVNFHLRDSQSLENAFETASFSGGTAIKIQRDEKLFQRKSPLIFGNYTLSRPSGLNLTAMPGRIEVIRS